MFVRSKDCRLFFHLIFATFTLISSSGCEFGDAGAAALAAALEKNSTLQQLNLKGAHHGVFRIGNCCFI
jgi:hypothetical protein